MFKNLDVRTKKTQKNILYSFLVKIVGISTSLILVPMTLNYLNPVEYGIWLTLNSILLWINTFDIGLGNGLRNKLSESLAKNDYINAKKYVSTAYFVVTLIMIVIFILFTLLNYFINWYEILRVNKIDLPNLNKIVIISFSCFCITFVVKLIGNILLAQQKAAVENLLIMLGQLLSLILIFILVKTTDGSLFLVALVYSISPAIVYLSSYPFVFRGESKKIIPNVNCIEYNFIKPLFSLGGQFFILQISGLVIFSTSNILLAHIFGPREVTVYNIANRLYSIVPLVFSVLLNPIWSATTEAYVKNDMKWIKDCVKKINILLLFTFLFLIVMFLSSGKIFEIWIGNKITVPSSLSLTVAFYTFLLVASLSYSSFLNGIGKLRVQMLNIVICACIFIPLTYFLCNIYGLKGVVLALIVVNFSGFVLNYIQFNMIVNHKATGVWNK